MFIYYKKKIPKLPTNLLEKNLKLTTKNWQQIRLKNIINPSNLGLFVTKKITKITNK